MDAAYHIDLTALADPGPVRFMPRIFIADPPCVDCRYAPVCGEQLLACRQFREYTNFNKWTDDKPRRPTRKLYAKVFAEDDD